jgi:DNA-binding MarR family transcriptional regulator
MSTKSANKPNVATINKYLKIFDVFQMLDVEMPIGQIVFFLNAAKLEGASLREVAEASDVKMTTASRYLANLSKVDRFHREGLDLLTSHENPMNRRMKVIELTPKGIAVLAKLD